LTPEALRWLETADWPGNVRQLENVIERAVALERGPLIQVSSLPSEQGPRAPGRNGTAAADPAELPESGLDLPRHLETQERELVSQALRQSGGRHDRAAKLLAISPRQFRYLLDKYALR
jgi:two-component system response regulator PilR (NtrC family)